MPPVQVCQLPNNALLGKYSQTSRPGGPQAYTDCFSVNIDRPVMISEFAFAFYTTPVFKLERIILKYLVKKPSTDGEARQLADGATAAFAAWEVESRSDEQLLMCDFQGRTRSWFMVAPYRQADNAGTRLYFGSAVVPVKNKASGEASLGKGFSILLGFHKLYSRVLLYSAHRRLLKKPENQ